MFLDKWLINGGIDMNRIEISWSYQNRNIPDLGERSLWAAVLIQAIEDLNPRVEAVGDMYINEKANRIRVKESALVWIKSSNDLFNSFIGICNAFDLCPDTLRRKILKKGG